MNALWLKRIGVVSGVAALLLGGFLLMQRRKPSATPLNPRRIVTDPIPIAPRNVQGIGPFTPYKSKRFGLEMTFNYPKNWIAGELTGKTRSFRQILIQGPRNPEKTYTTTLAILIAPLQSAEPYTGLENLIDSVRARHRLQRETEPLDLDGPRHVKGLPAWELGAAFTTQVPVSRTESRPVTVRQHDIFFEREKMLYHFSYSADEKIYAAFHSVLETCLDSIGWPGK